MRAADDTAIFSVSPDQLLDGLKALATDQPVDGDVAHLLWRTGLISGNGLTNSGEALFKTRWVLINREAALRALGLALRALTPVQVLEQELLQFGAVPDEGVLDLLRLHRATPADLNLQSLRKTFRNLAPTGLMVYSSKFKTVRAVEPPADEVRAGEERRLAAMVSPKTPFMNVVRLRRIIRTLRGLVWWADRHFAARALEELAEELDPTQVSELRIVSGTAANVLTDRSMKDFKRFREELSAKGILAEWRTDACASDWHDRWLADDDGVWNMPPVNNLFKNDYSEILPTEARPPLEDWWSRSVTRG